MQAILWQSPMVMDSMKICWRQQMSSNIKNGKLAFAPLRSSLIAAGHYVVFELTACKGKY